MKELGGRFYFKLLGTFEKGVCALDRMRPDLKGIKVVGKEWEHALLRLLIPSTWNLKVAALNYRNFNYFSSNRSIFFLFWLKPFEHLVLVIPFQSLLNWLSHMYLVKNLAYFHPLFLIVNFLSLKRLITLQYFDQGQFRTSNLDHSIRLVPWLGNWQSEKIYHNTFIIQMFQVEVINRISETEQCIVRNIETLSLVCCLTVMVIEVNWAERTYLGWKQFAATQELN